MLHITAADRAIAERRSAPPSLVGTKGHHSGNLGGGRKRVFSFRSGNINGLCKTID
jgi:hypothetical protein